MFTEKTDKLESLNSDFSLKTESNVMGTTAASTASVAKENLKIHIPPLSKKKRERPPALVSNAPESIVQNGKLTESAIFLLHAFSDVDIDLLRSVEIAVKPIGEFPFYNAWTGGGAWTIGTRIALTENYFDKTGYYYYMQDTYTDKKGNVTDVYDDVYATSQRRIDTSYGNDPMEWIQLLSHEVRHLVQSQAFGTDKKGIKKYKHFFAGQYVKYLGHNRVPFEKTADEGMVLFYNLVWDFKNEKYNKMGLAIQTILNNASISDEDKKKLLEALFTANSVDSFLNNIRSRYHNDNQKKYDKEEKQKEKAEEKRDKRLLPDLKHSGQIDMGEYYEKIFKD
ncbi:MAG TPA: hypothetical protein VFJ43_12435, partial [Bacteroidia bacterium]|nr:hypothetical protein [Bacteroidia bacterium]